MNNPETPEPLEGTPPKPIAAPAAPVPEQAEAEPSLSLTAAGPCQNLNGLYVGLNKMQRDVLGVQVGGTVEVFDGERSLGVYTVGAGSSDLLRSPERFTINGVTPETTLTLKKAAQNLENPVAYTLSHGIESDENHARRAGIISERFSGSTPDEYLTIPTALLNTLTRGRRRVPEITQGQVRIAGVIHTMVLVPSGTGIGLTTAASTKLDIPSELSEAQVRVENGVLIFN